jgi:hypothetical protein
MPGYFYFRGISVYQKQERDISAAAGKALIF